MIRVLFILSILFILGSCGDRSSGKRVECFEDYNVEDYFTNCESSFKGSDGGNQFLVINDKTTLEQNVKLCESVDFTKYSVVLGRQNFPSSINTHTAYLVKRCKPNYDILINVELNNDATPTSFEYAYILPFKVDNTTTVRFTVTDNYTYSSMIR